MKPAWDPIKLRVAWGDPPEPGDVLLFRTGRRYQVHRISGRTIHALVLPADYKTPRGTRILAWQWAPRKRSA